VAKADISIPSGEAIADAIEEEVGMSVRFRVRSFIRGKPLARLNVVFFVQGRILRVCRGLI
jgi:hypothetical protein